MTKNGMAIGVVAFLAGILAGQVVRVQADMPGLGTMDNPLAVKGTCRMMLMGKKINSNTGDMDQDFAYLAVDNIGRIIIPR